MVVATPATLAAAVDLGLTREACLVTGSTGGIGLETARLLATEGARVVTCGRAAAPGVGEVAHVVCRSRARRASPSAPSPRRPRRSAGSTCSSTTSGMRGRRASRTCPTRSGTRYWQLNVMSYVRAIRAALPYLREAAAARS